MSQNLQNFVKFQKFQLENLVDFEKCCKMHIFLQKSEPTQPKTSNILPKFCQPTFSDASRGRGAGPAPAVPPVQPVEAHPVLILPVGGRSPEGFQDPPAGRRYPSILRQTFEGSFSVLPKYFCKQTLVTSKY